ncbi:TetR/AcrR family transcriptional regulator [Parendozoicomonas haliclonae]|uniref:DNA-binding transcriptional repressor AcrR n=1 Tax=Parendozoicomonas haliclonae TaxID=1960125 RepID=A0A1X7AG82_9GAMM|nr:TetR/AcrR family transcriptional regulator [Parendozoicomonas haliclonae]SMA39444.1 DNA-binding transcriptional repressor AcrR [Parendozoicomonas haliclonae]
MPSSQKLTRSELKHSAILEAARLEFAEHGFQNTSMDGVSARAGVSKRTLYNHFSSKEELFDKITECLWKQDDSIVYCPKRPLKQQLRQLAEKKLELMASPGYVGLARSVMGEYMRSQEMAQAAMARFEENEDGVSIWFQAAMQDKRLREGDPKMIAHQFYGLLKTFALWPQLLAHQPAPTNEERDVIIEQSVDMILAYYQQ